MEFIAIINFYFSVALFTLLVNALIAGYKGQTITLDDVIQSSIWPVSIASLIGMLVRVGVESYKEEAAKAKKAPVKKENK